MEWLLILGLLGWVTLLAFRTGALRDRAEALERRVAELVRRLDDLAATPSAPAPKPRAVRKAAVAEPRPEPSLTAPATLAARIDERNAQERVERAPAPPPKPAGPPPREVLRKWLEENGLAWAGGAALALGGLFLVTYAAQRGMFTPPFRIAGAVLLGALLLGVSEWLKRRSGHPLAGALTAGAGSATLYGAAWASYWLYAFINLGTSAALMAVVSAGLLALAFRHGEPLAVLAVLGGFLAPAITGPDQWSAPALTGYLALMGLTGYAVAGARGWGWAGAAALTGAAGWALAGYAADDPVRTALLSVTPVVLAGLAVTWRRTRMKTPAGDTTPFDLMPAAALTMAAAFLSGAWIIHPEHNWLPAAGAGTAALALLAAALDRRALIPAPVQAIGYLPALASLLHGRVRPEWAASMEVSCAAVVVALAAAGVLAATGRRGILSRFAAAGAGLIAVLLAVALRGPVTAEAPWAPGAVAALLLFAGAVVIARRSDDPSRDLPLAVWLWAAGAGAIWALNNGLDPRALPVGLSALSLSGAALHARLGWRGFGAVAIGGALATLASLVGYDMFGALLDRRLELWAFFLIAGAATALCWAGAWLAGRPDRPREIAEAQGTAALLVGLTGAAVVLRFLATPTAPNGGGVDLFLEAALRTVLILAAGLTSAQAVRTDSSLIGKWRGHVLLAVGIAHGLLFCGLGYNPLCANWKPAVAGPPLLDSLAVGFLVPAALLAAATWKKVSINRALLAAYAAAAGLFALIWQLLELRRLFQGPSLQGGLDIIGRAEAGSYALVGLLAAGTLLWLGRRVTQRPWTISPLAREIALAGRWSGWAALGFALLVFCWGASPWWGPVDRPLAGVNATVLLLAVYAFGCAGVFALGRLTSDARLARAARLATAATAFALLNIVVRLGFRGYDMRPDVREAGVEPWAFSAVWGLYGFGLLVYGAARRSNDMRAAGLVVLAATLAKIFLFDMSRLDGVIRAASFLAVGALLLGAAVLVRRLSGGTTGKNPPPPAEAES
ncbi:MAG: hypothetical protein DI570_15665 [Phenylobacterium zucineum]|nr:MAG: hypothetical protein DI570_15665 [Phenylobacterium zucineum]